MQQDENNTNSRNGGEKSSNSNNNNNGLIVNVMDFDIDEEQEKEERELESFRQDANQRLAELKRSFKSSSSSPFGGGSKLPNSAPGLGSQANSSSSSISNLISNQQQTRQTISSSSSVNYTSRIINRTPGTVVPPPNISSSSSNTNVPFVPQKFIPPPRISQTSQNSQNSQRNSSGSSPSVGGSSSFVTPIKSTSLSANTTPVFIPPFSSTPTTPSSVGGSSGGASPLVVGNSPQVNVSPSPVLPDSYVPFPTTSTTIVANTVQQKNPIVKHIREKVFKLHFTKDWTLTDYILGRQTTAFYLSLKFHMTKPKYILERIKNFHKTEICKKGVFTNRIILVNVDVHVDACGDSSIYLSNQDSQGENVKAPTYVSETALDEALIEVTRISMWADWTVICGFSDEECALYLETIRACESKGSSLIQGPNQSLASLQASTNSLVTSTGGQGKRRGNRRWSRDTGSSSSKPVEVEKLSHTEEVHQLFAATMKNTLNKRDHITLLNHFGSLKEVIQTTTDELNDLPGFGKKKVKKLINLFQTPFVPGKESETQTTSKNPTTKKQSNIKLVKKSILPTTVEQEDEDDDIFIVDKETGKEEKVNCKLKVKRKQSEIGSFFSQKPKTEDDSD